MQAHLPKFHLPTEHEDYKTPQTLRDYADTPIPSVVRHRSQWLHGLNVLLEVAYETDRSTFVSDREVWQCVSDSVMKYSMTSRDGMALEHRQLLWTVWTRTHHLCNSTLARRAHKSPILNQLQLRPSEDSIRKYSLRELWRALMMLSEIWGALRYDDAIRDYVSALATQCGAFHWVTGTSEAMFNHPLFVEKVSERLGAGADDAEVEDDDDLLCVNLLFTSETERVFHALFKDLQQQADLFVGVEEYTETAALAPDQQSSVVAWLRRSIDNPEIRKFIDTDFNEAVIGTRIYPGEAERFAAKDRFTDATPYNILAKHRPAELDATTDKFKDASCLVEALLKLVRTEHDSSAEDARRVKDILYEEIDANLLGFFCATYALDSAFSADEVRFRVHFCTDVLPVPAPMRERPVIVQAMRGFHVRCDTRLWLCPDICCALWVWISVFCGSGKFVKEVHAVAPHVDTFFETYRALCCGQVSEAERLEAEHQAQISEAASQHLTLPDHYGRPKKRGRDDESDAA